MPTPDPHDRPALALLDPKRRAAIDIIAASVQREPVEILNDAVDAYVDLDRFHREQIAAGLKEANDGDFANDEDVASAFR